MNEEKQIEKLFTALSTDVREVHDAIGFVYAIHYKRNIDRYPVDISTPQNGLHSLALRFGHVAFFMAAGRLMDQDAQSYSLNYALKELKNYDPDEKHLTSIWRLTPPNWTTDRKPTAADLESAKSNFKERVKFCLSTSSELENLYKPIKAMRDKYFAHTDKQHADGEQTASLKVDAVDKFTGHIAHLFNLISELFQNQRYQVDMESGKQAGNSLLWLKRNERLDLGSSLLLKEGSMDDDSMRDFVLNFYKRNEPFSHAWHAAALQKLRND